jgi:hypothetical protein
MNSYFVWIDSFRSPPRAPRKISFAVEQLPAGPMQRLEGLRVSDPTTARRCELLRQENGIQVLVEGDHTLQFIVDRALAKSGYRRAMVQYCD